MDLPAFRDGAVGVVHRDIGDGEADGAVAGRVVVDVDAAHPRGARDIQGAVLVHQTEGVGGGHGGQTAGEIIEGIGDLSVCQHGVPADHVNAVAAEDPEPPVVVEIEVEIVGVGEIGHGGDLFLPHIGDGVAGDDPVKLPVGGVLLDAQDHLGAEAVLQAHPGDPAAVHDIDAVPVAAQVEPPVRRFLHAEDLQVADAPVVVVGGGHLPVVDQAQACGGGHGHGPVPQLHAGAHPVGGQAVSRVVDRPGVGFPVVAGEAGGAVGADPEEAAAVRLDAADPGPPQQIGKGRLPAAVAGVQQHQAVVRAQVQLAPVAAGGVDHHGLQLGQPGHVGKAVRHELHDALAGRGEPEVSLVVAHHPVHAAVQGDILQLRVAVVGVEIAHAVVRADPEVVPQHLEAVDLLLGVGGVDAAVGQALVQVPIEDIGALGAQVEETRLLRVGQYGVDGAGEAQYFRREIGAHPLVFYGEDVSVPGQAVDLPVRPRGQPPDVFPVDLGVVHQMQLVILPHVGQAHGGGDQDIAVGVLRDVLDGGGIEAVAAGVEAEDLLLGHHGDAALVGADPDPVPGVHKEAADAAEPSGGVVAGEEIAVVAHKAGVAPDEDKAVGELHQVVGVRGGQAAGVVVQHGGIARAGIAVGLRFRPMGRQGPQQHQRRQQQRKGGGQPFFPAD